MKKKFLLLATSLCTVSFAIIALLCNVFPSTFKLSADGDIRPENLSCEYFWNPSNGYRSLYDLNDSKLKGENTNYVTTWGTVTKSFTGGNGELEQYIQSTDQYGNVGATCLYNIDGSNQVFPVGSVVKVTGAMTLYYGMSEMQYFTVEKLYDSNPSPVVTRELTSDVFKLNSSSDEFRELRCSGTQKVHISNVSLGSVENERQAYATFEDDISSSVLLNFYWCSEQYNIANKINAIVDNSARVNVTGYLSYSDSIGGFQIYVRSASDIEEVVDGSKSITGLEITTEKTFFCYEQCSKSDFAVTAYFDDDSYSIVPDYAYDFVGDSYLSELGEKTIEISYTYNGDTLHASTEIYVNDRVYLIWAENPVTKYALYEDFIMPTVYANSYEESIDVTDDVVVTGFDSSYKHNYGTINISYVNDVGQTIEYAYMYKVATVTDITCSDKVLSFEYGQEFIMPTVSAHYEGHKTAYDVTGRTGYYGYDPYEEGEQMVTIYYGEASETYAVVVGTNKVVSYITISNIKNTYYIDDVFVKPTVTAHYEDGTESNVTSSATFSGYYDLSTLGEYTINVSYLGASDSFTISVVPRSGEQSLTIPSFNIGSYSTGNYGGSNGFEFYRAVKSYGNLVELLPQTSRCSVDTLPGSIYNVNPLDDIDSINIKYSTTSSSGSRSPRVSYGENSYDDAYYNLDYSTSLTNISIDLTDANVNYFRIDCGDVDMVINQVTIYYTGNSTPGGDSLDCEEANAGSYRIVPVTYDDSFTPGSSFVDVPTSIDTATGEILSEKRYTYYTFEYVNEHPECADDAAMVDPVDVCNYVLAFGCAPANYGTTNTVYPMKDGKNLPTKYQAESLFGSNARCISQYSRTDGYARAVPYAGGTPNYYELDIKTGNSYSISSREVGRIVYWATGFDKASYGNGSQGVCVFTDDHYATFSEYNNYGGFMPRFNAERQYVGRVWSEPTLVTLL